MTESDLAALGWTEAMMPSDVDADAAVLRPARVASVYAVKADVWTAEGPRLASIRAKVLRDGSSIEGGIAVGDWVLVAQVGGNAKNDEVVIERVLPRRTAFLRQAAGERAEPQSIAANVDRVFVVTDVERDFNVRRLERYLVAIARGGAEAQVILTKADLLIETNEEALAKIVREASALAPTLVTSAKTGLGMDDLLARVEKGMTVALVGSSGVGKSALVNRLLGQDVQLEGEVREHDRRGRHTTTRRSLFLLPGGGLLIDTPGMRELKPWLPDDDGEGGTGSESAFEDIAALAMECRYRDCTHEREPGCAVRAAVDEGTLPKDRVDAWQNLRREMSAQSPRQAAFQSIENKRRAKMLSGALRKRLKEKG